MGVRYLVIGCCREILSHSSFCHPHVVLFREVFLTPTHLGIALEYVSGGDLYSYVRRVTICSSLPPDDLSIVRHDHRGS